MSRFTIKWCENVTTTTGKKKMNAQLLDQNGTTTDNVSIWADFPNFDKILNGGEIEGDLVPAKDPKYGPTLYPPKPENSQPVAFKRQPGAIKQMMETKDQNITKHTENKEHAIKVSSTMRDAVLIATTIISNSHIETSNGDMKDLILHWRKWLWENFDKEDRDFSPF